MNTQRKISLTVLFIFLTNCFWPCTEVHAWNDRTHMLIAYLAFMELTPEQQEKIHLLLKHHPHYETFLLKDKPEECPEKLWVFMRAAIWPDFVNNEEHRGEYHRMRWHFVNIPYIPSESGASMADLELGAYSPNILTALDENSDVLSERYTSERRKAIALCWIVHLFGDVHQPLHCINLYSDRFPNGDQGGNRIAVRDGEKTIKLHAFWDNILGEDKSFASIQDAANAIGKENGTLEHEDRGKWPSWAKQSHELAFKYVYVEGKLPLSAWGPELQSTDNTDRIPNLSDEYKKEGIDVANRQVFLASKRLTSYLAKR